MIDRQELLSAFNSLLQPERFTDYGPNGLQVEGKAPIRKIVSGVTASRALIEAAILAKAEAIFVHHGLFWRGQSGVGFGENGGFDQSAAGGDAGDDFANLRFALNLQAVGAIVCEAFGLQQALEGGK